MYKSQSAEKDGSKFVAEILSSMSNGVGRTTTTTTTSNSVNRYHGYSTSEIDEAANAITPTTLSSIEAQFMDFQPKSDNMTQSGFVPPMRAGSSAEGSPASSQDTTYSDSEWAPPEKRSRHSAIDNASIYSMSPQRKPRRNRDEQLSPEEEQRRLVRRERNKLAAAKCRQRRVDHTNRLINETENLQDERGSLEAEIQKLQQQKDQYEFVLQAHKQVCPIDHQLVTHQSNIEHHTNVDHHGANRHHATVDRHHAIADRHHATADRHHSDRHHNTDRHIMPTNTQQSTLTTLSNITPVKHEYTTEQPPPVKHEYRDPNLYTTAQQSANTYTQPQYTYSPKTHSAAMHHDMTARPSSLSLNVTNNSVSSAIGISITTPSSGFFNFSNIDGFNEGGTGLTPVNSNPCGREMAKRESTDSSSPDNGLASPSLITLR